MKRIPILVLAVLLCLPNIVQSGRKKAPKSGKIKNNVFTDAKYNFQITLPEGWSTKRYKNKDERRLRLVDKSFEMNKYKPNAGNIGVTSKEMDGGFPILEFWVINNELNYSEFLDSILSENYKSKLKEKLIHSISPVWDNAFFRNFETQRLKFLSLDNHKGYSWTGRINFSFKSGGVSDVDTPKDGQIICIEIDENSILVILLSTAPGYFERVYIEIAPTISSIKWKK